MGKAAVVCGTGCLSKKAGLTEASYGICRRGVAETSCKICSSAS
jgi:hypothetical protein